VRPPDVKLEATVVLLLDMPGEQRSDSPFRYVILWYNDKQRLAI